MSHTGSCACRDEWRFEVCDLATGLVRGVLHPTSADFQTEFNSVGKGTLQLVTRDVVVRDIFPHLSSVYCLRTSGGTATPENPIAEFAGIVEEFEADDDGATQVGLKSIEQYLEYRRIRQNLFFQDEDQNEIARFLVNLAQPNGIPLVGVATPSEIERQRTYEAWERKQIGEAVRQLMRVINGPDWELRHSRSGGRWTTEMIFRDVVGVERALTIRSNIDAIGFGLAVDATNHATLVDALGKGMEQNMLIATAIDEESRFPQFDGITSHKTVSRQTTLNEHAEGFLEINREPIAFPSITVAGMEPDPADMMLGDTINVDISQGALTYRGQAQIITRAWRIGDGPTERTFELVPLTRSSDAILSQVPDDECKDCA